VHRMSTDQLPTIMALGYDTRLMVKDGNGDVKEYLHPAYQASHFLHHSMYTVYMTTYSMLYVYIMCTGAVYSSRLEYCSATTLRSARF
jgi:hypothetical protein